MGDLNAVEFGQAAHLAIAVRAGAISAEELIGLFSQVPRGLYAAGIIIDDHVGLELEKAGSFDLATGLPVPSTLPPPSSVGHSRFEAINSAYREVGLRAHAPDETLSSFVLSDLLGR